MQILKKRIILASISLTLIASTASTSVASDDLAKTKASVCFGCHGNNGVSMIPIYPNLAGQKELYIVKRLKDYKSGKANDPTMDGISQMMSDDDIKIVAKYFANMK